MIKELRRYVLILILLLCLAGCISHPEQPDALIEEVKPSSNQPELPVHQPTVPSVPSIPTLYGQNEQQKYISQPAVPHVRYYDWNGVMQPMVDKMLLHEIGVTAGSLLLVDGVNNRTNGSLNVGDATEMLYNVLAKNGKFTLVSTWQLSIAKQRLGLSPQDSLSARSKAIGIARNIGAQYVLYSNAIGIVTSPFLQMQLISVQTGEIIWSGISAVTQL